MDIQEQSSDAVNPRTVGVTRRWATTLHHKNLARSIGALAVHMAPHGWGHVKLILHLTKKPLLMRLAPFIAGFAVTAATTAGLLSFYSWYRELRDRRERAGALGES